MRPLFFLLLLCGGCGGTTGSDLVGFSGGIGGPLDLSAQQPFTTGSGWQVALDRARFHLGAVYLNENVPLSGNAQQPCVLPGIYVAQIFGPLDLDLLSAALIPFPSMGEGTRTQARSAEVWLLEGDINRASDSTVVLELAGTAEKAGASYPFSATVTIGQNRAQPPPSPAEPGANPICHQRIVSPIPVDLLPTEGGTLSVRVDPRYMLDGVDFSKATPVSMNEFVIPDEAGGIGSALFGGLHAGYGDVGRRVYTFTWNEKGAAP